MLWHVRLYGLPEPDMWFEASKAFRPFREVEAIRPRGPLT